MKNLLKKGILLSVVASSMATAAVFNETSIRSMSPRADSASLSIFERNNSSIWLVQTYQEIEDSSAMYKMQIAEVGRQEGSLLVDNGRRATNNLTELFSLSDGEVPVYAGGSVAPDSGSWVIYNVESCQVESCDTLRSYRMFLDKNGYPKSIYGQLSVSEIPKPKCEVDPSSALIAGEEGIVRHLGCGELEQYDYLFVKNEEFVSQALWTKNEQSSGIKTAWNNDSGYVHLLFSLNNDNQLEATLKQQWGDGVFKASSQSKVLADSLSQCELSSLDGAWGVVCLKSAEEKTSLVGWSVSSDGTWTDSFERQHDSIIQSYTVGYSGKHLFVFEQSEDSMAVTNQNKSGDVFTSRTTDSLSIPVSALTSSEYVFAVSQYIDQWGNPRFKGVMFDALSTDHPPYFKAAVGGTVPTLFDLETTIVVEDEDTLPSDIDVEMTVKPTWLEFNKETLDVFGAPSNNDVGVWPVVMVATDGAGQETELEGEITVVLTPAQINVFEPKLFERLELSEAVPLSELARQLGAIQILEDEPFEAQLSIEHRDDGDVTLAFDNLPDWLVFNSETMMLVGMPEQRDVGVSEPISVTILDTFNEDEDRYPIINITFDVIEVDEPFTVLSDGSAELVVGEKYYYQLEVDDEESTIGEFNVTPGMLPDWLAFDAERSVLSGIPTNEDTGRHLIQLVIQDEAGHTVVHKFELSVTGGKAEKSGGSTSFLSLLFIGALGALRRRK